MAWARAPGDGSAAQSPLVRFLARRRVPIGFVCGLVALWLATPSMPSIAIATPVAVLGELIRIWAAGHLQKGRMVTRSGPYRWTRHPLYLGSFLLGLGYAIASARLAVTVLVLGYLVLTLWAAMRSEEAALDAKFEGEYAAYREGRMPVDVTAFSMRRALANREYRAAIGLLVLLAFLVIRAMW